MAVQAAGAAGLGDTEATVADFNGAAQIGFLLGGGAKHMKQQAFDEGRLNTAKTEEALANAQTTQLKAKAAAASQRAAEKFKNDYIATESGKGRPPEEVAAEAELIGNLLIAGTGADYYASMQGQGARQKRGLVDTAADVETDPETRTRALGALHEQPYADLMGVSGTGGYTDITAEEPTVTIPPGGGGDSMSSHGKDFNFRKSLTTPEDVALFDQIVRQDRVVSAGGVPSVVPGINPTRQPARPVVDPTTVATNAGDIAREKKLGGLMAARAVDYPQTKFTLDQSKLALKAQNELANELLADDKLWQTVGPTQLISKIPGTEGAYLRAKKDTLLNKVMLATLLNLRAMSKTGGAVGNVSDREGETMRMAQAALSQDIMAGDFRKELQRLVAYNAELEKNLDTAFNNTYDVQGNPVAPGTAAAAGGASDLPQEGDIVLDEETGMEYQFGGGDPGDPNNWYPVAQ